jgi:ribosomal protein L9
MAGMAGRDVRMRVLLSEDSKLGLKHDVITVKRGYGRNVLVRQGKAVYATAENLHLANAAKLRAATKVAPVAQEEATELNTAPDAAAPIPVALPVDNLRYQLDLMHRLSTQRSPAFFRDVQRDGTLAKGVSTKDLYIKLARLFPSLTLSQITLASGQAITKAGEYTAEVALVGLAKPASFKVLVKKIGQKGPGAAATAAANAAPIPMPQAPKTQSKSIKG